MTKFYTDAENAKRREVAWFIFDAAIAEGFNLGTDGTELIYIAPRDRRLNDLSRAISEHWREIIPLVQQYSRRRLNGRLR
jgi:hypothetical protein